MSAILRSWEESGKSKNFLKSGKNDFRSIRIEKVSLRVLKKQTYTLSIISQNINIEGLNERFDKVCVFDSNENENDKKYLSSSKLIAIGSTQDFCIDTSTNVLHDLQQFYDSKKGWLFGYLTYDLKNEIEALNSINADKLGFPLLYFFAPKFVFQQENNLVSIFFDDELTSEKEAKEVFDFTFEQNLQGKTAKSDKIKIQSKISKQAYIQSVEKLKEHIRKGDIYEIL